MTEQDAVPRLISPREQADKDEKASLTIEELNMTIPVGVKAGDTPAASVTVAVTAVLDPSSIGFSVKLTITPLGRLFTVNV